MSYPDGVLRRWDNLNPNPGEADRDQSKLLRGRARQVNDASLYEGTSVIDPNDDVRAVSILVTLTIVPNGNCR
jgi:hypothetical protein